MVETLVIMEHDCVRVKPSCLSAISMARQLGGRFGLLVLGHGVGEIAQSLRIYGAALVLVANDERLAEPLADRYASVIARAAKALEAKNVVAASSSFSRDILPRAAALLDAPMLSDVTGVAVQNEALCFERPLAAGSLRATVKLEGEIRVLTARSAAFQPPSSNGASSPVETLELAGVALPNGMQFVSRACAESARPDLAEARVVVGGGRPLESKESFEKLIGGLADALGGAIGATRAAVDAGLAANDCQIGQTGASVAPELYIAVGISGSIQHLAGIQDSRVIVAINRDPDAPVFQVANYGLVGDLYDIVPRFIEAVRKN
jgi:electron transfer flavoprotein alpha subunit